MTRLNFSPVALAYLFFSTLLLEFFLKFKMEMGLLAPAWLYTPLFTLILALAMSLIFVFVKKARTFKILLAILSFILAFIIGSQLVYYDIFKTFYSLYSVGEGAGDILQFYKIMFYHIAINLHWIILILLPSVLLLILPARKIPSIARLKNKRQALVVFFLPLLLLAILFHGLAVTAMGRGDKKINSPYDIYFDNPYPNVSVMYFGALTHLRLDLRNLLFPFMKTPQPLPDFDLPEPSLDPTSEPSPTPSFSSDPTVSEEPVDPTPEPTPLPGPNAMDIDFGYLLENEKDQEIALMHKYFAGLEPSRKNEYTGLFEGYNLIFLTAESYSHLAIDKEITPTFYKMTHEGMHFTNFYNPSWGVSTSDGEYVATLGLIPKPGIWSMKRSSTNLLPFSMGHQYRKLGAETYAYHNHTYTYYGRDQSHPNLGYIYKGYGNGLKVKYVWPESDLEMMELSLPDFMGREPFHAYYMTVSGHMQYNFYGNTMSVKNRHYVDHLPYSDAAKAYIAANKELDLALEYLLEELEKAGVAERTLIVLSADHYPYGLPKKDIDALAGHEVEQNFELYKSSLLIYAKGMEPMTIDRPVSSLDILPTISNLLGLEFDSRLLMGTDMFSDSEALVIFNNRSFITEKGRYNSLTRVFESADQEAPDKEYVDRLIDSVSKKFYFSAQILDKDYYRLVFGE